MTDVEQALLKLVEDLRAENISLINLLLETVGVTDKTEKVIVPNLESLKGTGYKRWDQRKQSLENLFGRGIRNASKVGETIRTDVGDNARLDNGVQPAIESSGERICGEDPR